jgi:hypothetical protein
MELRKMIFATVAVALSSVALAGIVSSEEYALAARYEASGVHALTEQLRGPEMLNADAALLSAAPSKKMVRQ